MGELRQLQEEVSEWQKEWDPDPALKAIKLGEEAGEVLGAFVKITEGRLPKSALTDEIGDVVIVLAGLCAATGVDLENAVLTRWNDDVKHRPNHRPRQRVWP